MTLSLTLTPLPAFDDNYLWLLDNGHEALVVDPGDAAPVAAALDARGLTLAGILLTHHHADHVGGVDALRPRLAGPIYAPANETMPEPVQRLHGGGPLGGATAGRQGRQWRSVLIARIHQGSTNSTTTGA